MSFWSIFFLIAFLLFWAFDIYFWITRKYDTMSKKMVEWTKKYPILPFIIGLGLGIVAGHFWTNTGCY